MLTADFDIDRRREIIAFTRADIDLLASSLPLVEPAAEALAERLLDELMTIGEAARLVGTPQTMERMRAGLRCQVLDLFSGEPHPDGCPGRIQMVRRHLHAGVPLSLYLAAMRQLHEMLRAVLAGGLAAEPERLAATLTALDKAVLLETQMVADTLVADVVRELEAARCAVERHVEELEDVVAERTRQLEELSRRDSLTDLLNRRGFYECLRRELAVARRHHLPLSLVYLDLNGFKEVNDSLGHKAGDLLLVDVAAALKEVVREADTACRIGGDEFCIVLPHATAVEALRVCHRLIEAFRTRHTAVSFSIGVTQTGPKEFDDVEELVHNADTMMYVAKAEARQSPGHHVRLSEGGKAAEPLPASAALH